MTQQPNITDRLLAYAQTCDATGLYTEANAMYDAVNIITKLRNALHRIGYNYVEMSHDKVQYLYLEHIAIARTAYQESMPEGEPIKLETLSDDF